MTDRPPPAHWPALAPPLTYGRHRNASRGGTWHVWRPAPTPRSKARHETLCGAVMTEPPLGPDEWAPYTHLCRACADLLDKPPAPDQPFWRALSYNHPTAHHWTPAGSGSYRSACGITSHKAPFGKADLRHCDRCAAAAEKEDTMDSTEIKTFRQALPILAAHGHGEPKNIGGKLWQVGAQTLDKGGVIKLARELTERDAAPALKPEVPTKTPAPARQPRDTSWHPLPPALNGWTWQVNERNEAILIGPDGWETKAYQSSSKAVAEALRRINSAPRQLAPDATIEARTQANIAAIAAMAAEADQTVPAEAPAARGDWWGPRELPISVIRRDGGTQARVGLNEDVVQEYAESMRDSRWDWATIKRPIVYNDGSESGDYWLADGFHRIEAAQRAGLADYKVEILRGDKRAAQLHAARANADHGLRRSRQDVQRAIELLLRDEEWARWSDRAIAQHVHCDHVTVGAARKRLESGGEIHHLTERQGADGKTYSAPTPTCARCGKPAVGGGALTADGKKFCGSCAGAYLAETAQAAQAAQAAGARRSADRWPSVLDGQAGLPEPPTNWIIWQNDGESTIGMRHISGYKIGGTDARALIHEAESLGRPLAELADHGWRVMYDPTCPPDLHAYTAIHDDHESIAAHDLPHLACLAWRARQYEDDLPDVPDDVIDALYLAGYDWRPDADGWMRGATRIDQNTPIGELRYLAGLDAPPAATCESCGKPATTRRQIGGMLARWCDGCATKAELRAVCERAEALGATIDYTRQRSDGKLPIVPPAGYSQAELWCSAAELSRFCEAWERAGQVLPPAAAVATEAATINLPPIEVADRQALIDAIGEVLEAVAARNVVRRGYAEPACKLLRSIGRYLELHNETPAATADPAERGPVPTLGAVSGVRRHVRGSDGL